MLKYLIIFICSLLSLTSGNSIHTYQYDDTCPDECKCTQDGVNCAGLGLSEIPQDLLLRENVSVALPTDDENFVIVVKTLIHYFFYFVYFL